MYTAGWSKREMVLTPRGYAMHGYGQWHHRAFGSQSPLYSRVLYLEDRHGKALIFCCLDLGYITHAMRSGIVERLAQQLGDTFCEEALVLTCTHTHSGPGGCSHEALYNLVTPGYVPAHVEAIVAATTEAVSEAHQSASATEISFAEAQFAPETPVAWNRSVAAYNRNPDVIQRNARSTHLALDRTMPVIQFRRQGRTEALLSLFGVHATCVGSRQHRYDGDNKGYAAAEAEARLERDGAQRPVAIFAQGTAGDVSPHYHGPGDARRRRRLRGHAEYAYARRNGSYQTDLAFQALQRSQMPVSDTGIDALLSYLDFSNRQADSRFANGVHEAYTSEPCHGVAFFAGAPIDGPGLPAPLAAGARWLARRLRKRRLKGPDRSRYQSLYRSQGGKDILLEAGSKRILGMPLTRLKLPDLADPTVAELKRQARTGAIDRSALVPSVLPLQIVILGQLALVCCPGEFTTVAGARVRDTVAHALAGTGVQQVLICTYCNDYMGYVTTREEYQLQRYEGGHTVFGQWTLAAFQSEFARLAAELNKPGSQRSYDRTTRPEPAPAEELALRANLTPPR
ncbi:MAG: neutral/alkaline non-lysosomal ceramidase N-terminal domain-containing protein [Marinobacter sp.]|uniref:neutral/alkaline non-lysosomal ceramidase N-terminal domain-containing protein n=1 Tax=Marinobacter sp. TaxID=50741 RepID=UPI00299D5817|nr:neutral/alkaline non-lysosomal ceramidase N-terminal domain-containing protein [Marinobacter sp.]MDX1754567.1 neutral/alkaline non-lysosomal ceramidase N-terminal domain-containing protein [Marinobacter sp.]